MASSWLRVIDEALRALLFTKFQDIMGLTASNDAEETSVIIFPKRVAQRMMAEKRGRHELEFINLYRESEVFDWSRQRSFVARNGMYLEYTDSNSDSLVTIKAVPTKMTYNTWFWSTDLDKLNDVKIEYLFWQHENPYLSLSYNDSYPVEMDLHFGEIVDESDIEEMFNIGKYHVLRLPITLDGWVFKTTNPGVIQKIVVTIYDQDSITDRTEFLASPNEELQLYQEEIEE